jgi:hypothetical protein
MMSPPTDAHRPSPWVRSELWHEEVVEVGQLDDQPDTPSKKRMRFPKFTRP